MAFQFPKVIEVGGVKWSLLYDPTNPNTLLPDLTTPKVQDISGQWIQAGDKKLYLVIVNLVYPAISKPNGISPARHVRGMRVYPSEVNPEVVPPQEMVMYIEEVTGRESYQDFFSAIVGTSIEESKQPVNTNWANEVLTNEQ